MIEVETKIKIENPEKYRKKIRELARFIKKETKKDEYYTLQNTKSYPLKSLRVRKKGKEYEINFKQKISFIKKVHAKIESEFSVSDIKKFLALIKDFGFRKWLTKVKYSETYKIKDNFNIELNNLKGLGWFVEIEYLVKEINQINKARKDILEIIESLGLDSREIIEEGYTKLLWDKTHPKRHS